MSAGFSLFFNLNDLLSANLQSYISLLRASPVEMLGSAPQHLAIYSPSSTTISYTVSNASSRSTRSSKIFFVLGNVLRTFLCLSVLAIDVAKLQSIPHLEHLPIGFDGLQQNFPGGVAWNFVRAVDWRLTAAGSFLVIYICLRKGYTGESTNNHHRPELRG